jgi:Ni/Fe-hydrogenase subunit HybB-like protein
VPPPVYPGLADILMVVGLIGLAALVYLLGTRMLPLVSVWETKEGAQYQRMDTLFKGHYLVLAKPE